jgi:hypothetical protein
MKIQHLPLTRRYAYMVAGFEFGAAVTGLVLPASHFQGVSYNPADRVIRSVFHLPGNPSTWWSWLLVILSVTALVSIYLRNDRWTRHAFAALCGWWVFWVVLYAAAWHNPGAGPWGPWLAGIAVVGNSRPVIAPSLSD